MVPGTAAVYLPLRLAWGAPIASGAWLILGAAGLAVGLAVYVWCVWDFAAYGRGTPAPIDAPRRLVLRGLYRYTRNPMYLGVLAVVLGWTALFRSPGLLLYGLALGATFHLFVVLYEEPHLRATFGPEYEAYCARVGRWWPGLRSHPRAGAVQSPTVRREDPNDL